MTLINGIGGTVLHRRLVASQTASPQAIDLDTILEERVIDLQRIRGHILGRTPGELSLRKIEAVASRLLQATQAYRMADDMGLPSDCEASD